MSPFIEIIEFELRFGESHDLKGKRKELHSIKAQLRQRFGASVAEVDGHDKWQRATLLCALVGDGTLEHRADDVVRWVESRVPDGCSVRRDLRSVQDIRG